MSRRLFVSETLREGLPASGGQCLPVCGGDRVVMPPSQLALTCSFDFLQGPSLSSDGNLAGALLLDSRLS